MAAYLSAALTRQTLELLGLVTQFSAFFRRPWRRCCSCLREPPAGQRLPGLLLLLLWRGLRRAGGGPEAKLHTELAAPATSHKPRGAALLAWARPAEAQPASGGGALPKGWAQLLRRGPGLPEPPPCCAGALPTHALTGVVVLQALRGCPETLHGTSPGPPPCRPAI